MKYDDIVLYFKNMFISSVLSLKKDKADVGINYKLLLYQFDIFTLSGKKNKYFSL